MCPCQNASVTLAYQRLRQQHKATKKEASQKMKQFKVRENAFKELVAKLEAARVSQVLLLSLAIMNLRRVQNTKMSELSKQKKGAENALETAKEEVSSSE